MAKCTNCAAEIGMHQFCAVCGAPAPRSTPVHIPTEVERRSTEAERLHVAPMWERLIAGGIDAVLAGTWAVLVGFPALLFFQLGAGKALYDGGLLVGGLVRVALAALILGGPVAYSAITEGGSGQTVGKKSMRVKVVRYPSGRPIDGPIALRRALGRIVSLAVGALGIVVAGRDPLRRTWHDVWSGTVVIDTDPARGATAPKVH